MSILAFEVVFVSQLSICLNVEKDKMGEEMINRQVMSLPSFSSSIHLTPVHQNQFMDHLSTTRRVINFEKASQGLAGS